MKVIIATPAYNNSVNIEYLNSLTETILKGKEVGIEFIAKFIVGNSIVHDARNQLVKIVKDSEADSVIWIDSDMEWNADWAIKFVKSDLDILGAPCIKRSMREMYNVVGYEDLTVNEDGILKAKGIGTGFLKMSKKAINYLWDVSDKYAFMRDDQLAMVFEFPLIDGKMYGEDIYACKKLIDGGFDINVDTTITINHVGSHKFLGSFANYLEQIKKAQDLESFELAKELGLV